MVAGAAGPPGHPVSRVATVADLEAVRVLDAACFAPSWTAATWRHELGAVDRRWRVVAVPGPAPVAVAGLGGLWLAPDAAHVLRLGVAPARRRQGLGDLLLVALVEAAEEAGAEALTLEVRASNVAATSLYRRHGFVTQGVRPRYYPDGEDAVILGRQAGHRPRAIDGR